jgi:hypothetical protein
MAINHKRLSFLFLFFFYTLTNVHDKRFLSVALNAITLRRNRRVMLISQNRKTQTITWHPKTVCRGQHAENPTSVCDVPYRVITCIYTFFTVCHRLRCPYDSSERIIYTTTLNSSEVFTYNSWDRPLCLFKV